MSAISHGFESGEYVSGIALEILDELRIKVMECRLALQFLPAEADLNFEELDHDLHAAQQAARLAHHAASLVHQGARLDPRWGNGWSRPKAIFARHRAAVRDGANEVRPKPATSDPIERSMWQLPTPDRVKDTRGTRPRCAAAIRATGHPCTTSAMYLGGGVFAAHCYSHANPAERQRYRQHTDSITASDSDAYDQLAETRRAAGETVTNGWLLARRRRQRASDPSGDASEIHHGAVAAEAR